MYDAYTRPRPWPFFPQPTTHLQGAVNACVKTAVAVCQIESKLINTTHDQTITTITHTAEECCKPTCHHVISINAAGTKLQQRLGSLLEAYYAVLCRRLVRDH